MSGLTKNAKRVMRNQSAERRKNVQVDFTDKVNHPSHYNKGSIEVIEMIEDQGHGKGFTIGNAIKYTMRAGVKGDEIEDLEKAIWYLRRRIEQIKAEREKRPALRPNEMPQQRQ